MDDEPKTVKELLVELKDASELMVDLAYAAVFFNEEKLAREVGRLEERMDGHLRRLRIMAMLAARSPEDAEGMAGVLWIADAIERIGDAASDIARVVAARLGIPDALRQDLRHADEMTARVKIRSEAPAAGRTLRDLSLPTETGMWVMAIRGGMNWRFDPGPDDVVSEHDVLLVRGPEEGVNLVRELAGAAPLAQVQEDDAPALSELDRAVDILVEMKDLSEAAVGLAYSSLLFNNRSLAAEVGALEARSDILHDELESWVLRAAPEARNPDELRGLLRLASASEYVCDSARDMTWYVEHGEPLHPVVQMALGGDGGDVRRDGRGGGLAGRRHVAAGAPRGDRDRDVRPGGAARSEMDLPAASGVRLHGRRPIDLGRPRGRRGRAPGALQRRPARRRGALMDAYVYMQVAPGKVPSVLTQLAGRAGLRKALAVVGNWDVLVQIEGPDLDQIAATVLSQLHGVDGVIRTLTTPVVPADRVGVAGFGNVQAPPIVAGACYVHVQAQAGAAAGLVERVSEMQDVAGVAVLGGDWDLLICIAQPWEVASGVVLEEIHSLPGVERTSTLVSIAYEEPDEDRDQFSAWI